MDCTPSCRLANHAQIILSAITREDLPTFHSILKRVCSNPTNLTDHFGRHAVHVAASCGKTDIIEWLVKESKVDIGLRDVESRWTPLHRSLFYGKLTCALKLLQLGADLYAVDKDDLSPLDLVRLDSPFKLSVSVEGKVIFNYGTNLEDELSLNVGDVVTNIHMTGPNYWTGNLKGQRGFFPKDCVQLIKQDYRHELYTWGTNTNFTLGHQDESLRQRPHLVENLSNDKSINIKEVVMCRFHSIFLSQDGRLFTCGHGRGGRLGHGNEQTQLAPKQVKSIKSWTCVSAAAAQDHTAVVTNSGSVFTFGMNNMQQLGHTQAPPQCLVPTKIEKPPWKRKHIIGVAAGQYHTVFYTHNEIFTCGLNIGQLGHLKKEKFHVTPKQVTPFCNNDITMVTCNDAATVCATSKGDIFVFSHFTCQKVVSRFQELVKVVVSGADVDLNSNYEAVKVHDQLTLTLLNAKGLVYEWKESDRGIQRCKWLLSRELLVSDVAVGKKLYILTDYGEMFACTNAGGGHPVVRPTRSWSSCSPSTPFGAWDQKHVINYNVTRCPMVHRGVKIFTDKKSKGFAVLQVDPTTGLMIQPKIRGSSMQEDFEQLLEETVVEDDIHDVHLVVKGHVFPAHAYILATRSHFFRELLTTEHKKRAESHWEGIMTVTLDDVQNHNKLNKYLKDLYNGLPVNDSCLFDSERNYTMKPKNVDPKPKTMNHSNKVERESGELSECFVENFMKVAGSFLDDFGEYIDKGNEKAKRTEKTEIKTKVNANKGRKKRNKTLDAEHFSQEFVFNRTSFPELYDFTIESEDDVIFLCHKCVLVARLDYFKSMLACGWLEASNKMKVLNMPIHSSVLKIVLEYLYTDEAKELQGHHDVVFLGNLLAVADQLLISRLTEICESAMAKLISYKNVIELLEFSCVYNASQLKAACLEFVCYNLPSLLEAGYLNLSSKETLEQISTAYQEMIPGMPWRIITPTHDHLSFLTPETSSSSSRKRRISSRKRSVKSESEGEAENDGNTSQDGMLENRSSERKISESTLDSVFDGDVIADNSDKCQDEETSLVVTTETTNETLDSDNSGDEGVWYRKQKGKDKQFVKQKSKKNNVNGEENIKKASETPSKAQEIPKPPKQDQPSKKPAWGTSFTSASSPPSSDLRAIMEQQESASPPETMGNKSSAVKMESKGKLSQKQKKRAMKDQQLERGASPEVENKPRNQEVKSEPWKPKANPWLIEKTLTPVRSLRELIEQEEKSHCTSPKTESNATPNSTRKQHDKRKTEKTSSTASRKISWGLPRIEQKVLPENKEPTSTPESAWISSSSPDSSPTFVPFADILHLQERENTNLNRTKEKPLSLIQNLMELRRLGVGIESPRKLVRLARLEDRAMQELLEYYGGRDCACEMIVVDRITAVIAVPVWNRQRTASSTST